MSKSASSDWASWADRWRHIFVPAATNSTFTTTSRSPPSLIGQGAIDCASGKEVAQHAEIIITMVPDTPHVASALFDADGVAAGLSPERSWST